MKKVEQKENGIINDEKMNLDNRNSTESILSIDKEIDRLKKKLLLVKNDVSREVIQMSLKDCILERTQTLNATSAIIWLAILGAKRQIKGRDLPISYSYRNGFTHFYNFDTKKEPFCKETIETLGKNVPFNCLCKDGLVRNFEITEIIANAVVTPRSRKKHAWIRAHYKEL